MDRLDFLHGLYLELDGLPETTRREMLYDYEEHFRVGLAEGRSEEDIASSLGNPQMIARELKGNVSFSRNPFSIPRDPNFPNFRTTDALRGGNGFMRGCLVSSALFMFNLIFILGPALGILGALFGFWCAAAGMVLAGFVGAIATIVHFAVPTIAFMTLGSLSITTALAGCIALLTFGILSAIALWYVTVWVFKMLGRYLAWNGRMIFGSTRTNGRRF